jgi:hypothetical protein
MVEGAPGVLSLLMEFQNTTKEKFCAVSCHVMFEHSKIDHDPYLPSFKVNTI